MSMQVCWYRKTLKEKEYERERERERERSHALK